MQVFRKSAGLIWVLVAGMLGATAASADEADNAQSAALKVMNEFMRTFNDSDVEGLSDTLVYPHVRLASGQVRIFPDRQAFIDATDMAAFASSTGWRRSRWDDMEIIQSSDNKVHIRVRFSRFDESDDLLASYDSLYVIEQVDGRWGVRARSSFAP
jgi:hypothetical protein